MRLENPTKDFGRAEWIETGQRVLLFTGVALIGVAAGVPWGAGVATEAICGPNAGLLGCGERLTGLRMVILKPLIVGAACIITATMLEKVGDDVR